MIDLFTDLQTDDTWCIRMYIYRQKYLDLNDITDAVFNHKLEYEFD